MKRGICTVLGLMLIVSACDRVEQSRQRTTSRMQQPPSGGTTLPYVRTTSFEAGEYAPLATIRNPYEHAVDEGRRYYMAFNCNGCHGARGGGGIGPPFAVADFIYGNEPANIFQSIVQGRPHGMPSFGGKAPDEVIWKIAAYVGSLSQPFQQDGPGASEGDDDAHGDGGG